MKPSSRLIVIAAAVALTAAPVSAQGMRTDDWYRLNRVSDVQFAPDAKSLVYVSTRANRESQRHDAQIWLIAADGRSDAQLLSSGFVTASQPRYSLDGTQLAFLGRKSKTSGRRFMWRRPVGARQHASRMSRAVSSASCGHRMGGALRSWRV